MAKEELEGEVLLKLIIISFMFVILGVGASMISGTTSGDPIRLEGCHQLASGVWTSVNLNELELGRGSIHEGLHENVAGV